MTTPVRNSHRRGVTLMVTSAALFTVNVLLIRALGQMETVNVWLISSTRFIMGLALVIALYRDTFQPRHLFANRKLIERGLSGGLGVFLFYLTVVHLGAGRATFINNTYLIWGAILAAWILGEKIGSALVVGSIAALAGLALLTNVFASGTGTGTYDLVAILTALLSAWVVVTIRQLHATESTATIFAAQCVYGLLICGGPALLHPATLSPAAWGVMLLAGVFAGAGQIAMTRAFRDLSVAEGSLLQMLAPLGIATGGAVFFHEHYSQSELIGAALILGGTAFTAMRSGRPAQAK